MVANAFKGIQACVIYLILSAGVKMLKNLQRTPFNTAVVAVVLAAMVGGAVMLIADILARSLYAGGLPISILTTIIGVPVLVYFMCKRKEGKV